MTLLRPPSLGALLAAVSACTLGSSPTITGADLSQRIERGDAPRVLDVRSDKEFAAGHVPGAVHIPFRSVGERHAELGVAKDDPVVVYCAHGPRAVWAGAALRDEGYTQVVYLEGHMSSWSKAGLPTEAGAEEPAAGR